MLTRSCLLKQQNKFSIGDIINSSLPGFRVVSIPSRLVPGPGSSPKPAYANHAPLSVLLLDVILHRTDLTSSFDHSLLPQVRCITLFCRWPSSPLGARMMTSLRGSSLVDTFPAIKRTPAMAVIVSGENIFNVRTATVARKILYLDKRGM